MSLSRRRSAMLVILRDTPPPRAGVRHQHAIAAGQRQIGGQRRALVAALLLGDLDQHDLPALDRPPGSCSGGERDRGARARLLGLLELVAAEHLDGLGFGGFFRGEAVAVIPGGIAFDNLAGNHRMFGGYEGDRIRLGPASRRTSPPPRRASRSRLPGPVRSLGPRLRSGVRRRGESWDGDAASTAAGWCCGSAGRGVVPGREIAAPHRVLGGAIARRSLFRGVPGRGSSGPSRPDRPRPRTVLVRPVVLRSSASSSGASSSLPDGSGTGIDSGRAAAIGTPSSVRHRRRSRTNSPAHRRGVLGSGSASRPRSRSPIGIR